MDTFFASRFIIPAVVLAAVSLPACDSSSDSNEVRIAVEIEGSGSGTIESRPPFFGIECRVADGEVSGDCEESFVTENGRGTMRLVATPEINTDFSWGSPCGNAVASVCEITFDAGEENSIDVKTNFEAKTVQIVMNPPNASITVAGDDGAIFITAQAVDENGVEVLGVVYAWEVDRPDVLNMVRQSDPRRVMVTPIVDGVAVVTASAQGVVGTTPIEVELSN